MTLPSLRRYAIPAVGFKLFVAFLLQNCQPVIVHN
jgi:hypothetical protein